MNKPAAGISRIDKPRYSCLILCHRCFFHCQMCLDWKAPATASSLTFDDCKSFLDGLSEFVDYALDINIMGGEPFMFDWIVPLCDYIHDKGFTPIISTNGYLLDEEMVKRIVDSHLNVLAISLDGFNEATHDSIRGTQGAYARVMRALEYLRKYRTKKPKIALLTLILEKNLEELPKLVEWVKKTGIIDEISFTALQECGLVDAGKEDWFRRPEYKNLWPQDHKKLTGVIDTLIALKKEGHQIINPFLQLEAFKEYYHDPEKFLRETTYRIHDYIIDLDPTNEAFLSGHCLGSVKAGPRLEDIWFSEKANQIRREISAHGCDNSRAKVINYLCAFHDGKPIAGVAPPSKYEAQLHGQRGLFYQQEGKHDLAIAQFKKALELDPHSAQLHVGLASSYSQLKQYYAAVEAYDEAFRLNPDIRDDSAKNAYTGLGLFCQQEGKHDLAIVHFKKALELDPHNADLYIGIAVNYGQLKNYHAAVEAYNEAFRLNPDIRDDSARDAYAGLGVSYQQEGKHDLALVHFKKALELDPQDANLYASVAFNYLHLKDYQASLEAYHEAFRLNPDTRKESASSYEQALRCGGLFYQNEGKHDLALAQFKKALELDPQDASVYIGVAYNCLQLKDYHASLEAYHEAFRLNPDTRKESTSCYEQALRGAGNSGCSQEG